MFSNFDDCSQKILLCSKKEMLELKHPYIGTEHLLLAILHNDELNVTKFLNKYGLYYNLFREEIIKVIGIGKKDNNWFLYTPLLKRVIENANIDAKDNNTNVSVDMLFASLLSEGDGVANRILIGMNIDIDVLYDKFLVLNNSYSNKSALLDKYADNMNLRFRNTSFDPVFGRENEINRIISILLRRTKNNPILLGDAGVGKTAIVEELVRKIELKDVPNSLLNISIYNVSMASLIAGTKYRGEFEERLNQVIEEVNNNKNIILFIDEIHTLVGAGGAEGAIDASNILKPYLARGNIRIIGATTYAEYKKFIENDKALSRRFQKVNVNEPSIEETRQILFNIRNIYENYHDVQISDEIIDNIINLSSRYINSGKLPDKVIDVFDEVCARSSIRKNDIEEYEVNINKKIQEIRCKKNNAIKDKNFKLATAYKNKEKSYLSKLNCNISSLKTTKKCVELDDIYSVIYDKTKIPLNIFLNRKEFIMKLSKNIYGQDVAIHNVVESLFSYKNIDFKRPISFLLNGGTGVGKSYFVEELVNLLNIKSSYYKFNMDDFNDTSSLYRLIGYPNDYNFNKNFSLVEKVKDNPFSVILFDNVDKACQSIKDIINNIIINGKINDSLNEEIDFSHSIIFLTINSDKYTSNIGFSNNSTNSFEGELCNNVCKKISFISLNCIDIRKIVLNKLSSLSLNNYSTEIVNKIIEICDYQHVGGKNIDKCINEILFSDKCCHS